MKKVVLLMVAMCLANLAVAQGLGSYKMKRGPGKMGVSVSQRVMMSTLMASEVDPFILLEFVDREINAMDYPQDETELEQGKAILDELLPVIVGHLSRSSKEGDQAELVQAQGFLLAHVVLTAPGGREFHILDPMEQFKAQMEPLLTQAQEVLSKQEAAIQANPKKEELIQKALDPYKQYKEKRKEDMALKFDFQ